MLSFFYKLQKIRKKKNGFTLIELIVVIAIIGVLASIIIPVTLGYVRESQIQSANASASLIRKNVEAFMLDLSLQNKGMRIGKHINAQVMFMVKNGEWLVKTECKVNGAVDSNGSLTFFDHENWWKNNATGVMLDTTTKNDPNHQLALCRCVADCLPGLTTGFIMCFFTNGVCKGVVYIPGCDYVWPGNYYGDAATKAAGRQKKRPILVHGRTDPAPRLKEFSPWAGVWPEKADDNFWDGHAGVDVEGFIVGTYPVIGYTGDG